MHPSRRLYLALSAFALVGMLATDASALRYQPRPHWQAGVGYGIGRGAFTGAAENAYHNGASPAIRFGRTLGEHYMVSVNYQGWLIEYGNEPLKIRRMMQSLALGLAVFPGSQQGPLNGLYIRAGAGMGWTGIGSKEAIPDEAQHTGERIDEWGVGVFGELGYEFWVSHDFTVGLGTTFNYFSIQETWVDTSWFSAVVLNLNLYF